METIRIYGASDDLVEVEGALGDEWGGGSDPAYVVLSTGDVFTVAYGMRGVWQIEHVANSGLCAVTMRRAANGDDPDPYTDEATVSGPFTWVDCWSAWPAEDDQVRTRLEDRLDQLTGDALMAAYKSATGQA